MTTKWVSVKLSEDGTMTVGEATSNDPIAFTAAIAASIKRNDEWLSGKSE